MISDIKAVVYFIVEHISRTFNIVVYYNARDQYSLDQYITAVGGYEPHRYHHNEADHRKSQGRITHICYSCSLLQSKQTLSFSSMTVRHLRHIEFTASIKSQQLSRQR